MQNIFVRDAVKASHGRLLSGDADAQLAYISIDSRTAGKKALFVPLIGEKQDGHRFIMAALEQGAAAVFTSEHSEESEEVKAAAKRWPGAAFIQVDDTRRALQELGAYLRSRLTIPLVGITGSVGKTTTREMVAAALSAGFHVFKTPANHNSQVGVPLTLSQISDTDEIGVLELGMSEPGEMTVIAQIAAVDMAVITNVGVTHIENLGTRENILREKLKIQDGMRADGPVFLNGDNDLLGISRAREGHKTVYFGTGENADYRAVDIRLERGCPSFTMVHGERRIPVTLSVMGEHNVLNALAALAVADYNGVPLEAAAEKLREFTGFKNRQQIREKQGITVIDDTYNASPDSMKAALRVLSSFGQARRRVAVLADMKELGPDERRFHREVGEFLAGEKVELLVTFGELAGEIGEGARERRPSLQTAAFTVREKMTEFLKRELSAGDCVLFKGSNSMKLGETALLFYGENDGGRQQTEG